MMIRFDHGVGSGDLFEMKICPLVNFLTTQQMKCKHFFVFAVPKFGCLWKSAYFCPRHKEKLEKNDHQNRPRDLSIFCINGGIWFSLC